MPECSRGGEEHAHQAEERGRGRGRRTKKDKKEAGDKRGQFRSQQKLLKSSAKQRNPAPDRTEEKKKKIGKKNRSLPSITEATGGQAMCLWSCHKTTLHQWNRNPEGSVKGLQQREDKTTSSLPPLRCRVVWGEQHKYIIAAYKTT